MNEESKKEFAYISSLLEKEKKELQNKLSSNSNLNDIEKSGLISKTNLINFSQKLLNRCFEFNVKPKAIWKIVPEPKHMYSEYRLMEDDDSDNKEYWTEVEHIRLSGGNIIIQ